MNRRRRNEAAILLSMVACTPGEALVTAAATHLGVTRCQPLQLARSAINRVIESTYGRSASEIRAEAEAMIRTGWEP